VNAKSLPKGMAQQMLTVQGCRTLLAYEGLVEVNFEGLPSMSCSVEVIDISSWCLLSGHGFHNNINLIKLLKLQVAN
jgi:hypothetical protein